MTSGARGPSAGPLPSLPAIPSGDRTAYPTAEGRKRQHGFTLIEVLVALTIVAISLAAGIKAASALTDNAERLADITAGQWCADNQLTGLKLLKQFPGVGDSDFACQQLGRTFRGRLVVRPTPNPNFRRVDAVVLDTQGRVLLTLSTVMGNR